MQTPSRSSWPADQTDHARVQEIGPETSQETSQETGQAVGQIVGQETGPETDQTVGQEAGQEAHEQPAPITPSNQPWIPLKLDHSTTPLAQRRAVGAQPWNWQWKPVYVFGYLIALFFPFGGMICGAIAVSRRSYHGWTLLALSVLMTLIFTVISTHGIH